MLPTHTIIGKQKFIKTEKFCTIKSLKTILRALLSVLLHCSAFVLFIRSGIKWIILFVAANVVLSAAHN